IGAPNMADVNKTIEISMKADIKQMLQQLKKIPGMTKEEAKKMVSGFQKELKQAQSAAKKAAQVNERAMKKMGRSFDHAKHKARELRKQSREVGGAFGAMEDVVSEVNPELAGMAMTLGTVGSAARTVSRTIATGNPYIIAAVVAITAAIAAYTAFTSSQRAAERQQKLFNEAMQETDKRFATQADIIRGITSDYNKAKRELMVFQGQMTQVQADLLNAAEANDKSLQADLQRQDEFIIQQKELLQLAAKAKENASRLTEEEEKRLNKAMLLTEQQRLANGISSNQTKTTMDMFFLEQELQKEIANQTKLRAKIIQARKAELLATEELIELKAIEEAQEAQQEARDKRRAKAAAEQKARTASMNAMQLDLQNKQKTTQQELFKMSIARMEPEKRIEAEHAKQLQNLREQRNAIRDQFREAQALAKTDKDRTQLAELEKQSKEQISLLLQKEDELTAKRATDLHNLYEQENKAEDARHEKRKKNLEQEAEKARQSFTAVSNSFVNAANTTADLIERFGEKNKKNQMLAFNIRKGTAISEAVINTALAVTRAIAELGPVAGPLAAAAITATGAAQIALIASEAPKFHTGGMIGTAPDERVITAQPGEFVLSKQTVQRVGAENIERMNRGADPTKPIVIVSNPFKHYDRFIKGRALSGIDATSTGRMQY
ncbi:MAG: hypothetical protein VX313_01090, partial [Bacteroidota bacterium]|nr:hypothetical protein [Bacteroidota bacterium]